MESSPYIICLGRGEEPPPTPSQEAWCLICAVPIWVSNAMWPIVLGGEMQPTCIACGVSLADQEGVPLELHPRVAQQMANEGLLPEVKAFTKNWNRLRGVEE
jgi:hypothetical protein